MRALLRQRQRPGLLLAATILVASAWNTGCASAHRPLVVDSRPAGALVLLDGQDTGFATPCVLSLKGESYETLELRLDGYETAVRRFDDGEWSQAMLWRDMSIGNHAWRFPLFLRTEDLFFPVKESDGEMPHRIYVRLERLSR